MTISCLIMPESQSHLGAYIKNVGPAGGGNIIPPQLHPMAFRVNSHAFFLTYPRCLLEPATLGAHLESIAPTKYCLVARELHQDGESHLHALIIYIDKKNVRRADFFDHQGYHPNIVAPRDRPATVTYIKKNDPSDDDLYETGEFLAVIDKENAWKAAIDATTAIEVHQIISASHPREYVVHHDKIEYYASKKQRTLEEYTPPPGQAWVLPDSVTQYLLGEFTKEVSSPSASSGRSRDRSSL